MCGIFAGCSPNFMSNWEKILTCLSYRGPDGYRKGEIKTSFSSIWLLTTRLAFVGEEIFPIVSDSGDLLIANGEIYNHSELFSEILSRPDDTSKSDFRCIVDGYRRLRSEGYSPNNAFLSLLRAIRGDFALILFDQVDRLMFVARDRFGIRPLWYVEENDTSWAFASEKSSLTALGSEKDNIKRVPPGHWTQTEYTSQFHFEWSCYDQSLSESSPPRRMEFKDINLSAKTEELRILLEKSVFYVARNLPKGPRGRIGLFLSGGLDSSVLYAICKKLGVDFVPFSVGFPGSTDLEYARDVLYSDDTDRLVIEVLSHKGIENVLPAIISRLDNDSIMDISIAIPLFFLAKTARAHGIGACLTGQGADELFFGYKRYDDLWRTQTKRDQLLQTEWNDFREIGERNLERDDLIASYHGVELRHPYLDKSLVNFVLALPLESFFGSEGFARKRILRFLAKEIKVKESIIDRKKTAIQYGTGVQKALKELARKENDSLSAYLTNMRRKGEYPAR